MRRTLALLFIAPTISLVLVATATAAPPDVDKTDIDESLSLRNRGFRILLTVEGSTILREIVDRSGTVRFELKNFSLTDTWTNVRIGASISTRDAGPTITTTTRTDPPRSLFWA